MEYIKQIPYATLVMMLADAPKYKKKKDEVIRIASKEQLLSVFGQKG